MDTCFIPPGRVRRTSLLLFSCSPVFDSLRPHGLQHTRLLCPFLPPSLLKFMSTESVMLSNYLMLRGPLILLPSIFPSIKIFSSESDLHIRWSKDWSFSISPSNECSGLILFKIDWFGFLAVQGTLKSLFQHHHLKASIFGVQPYLWSKSHIHT